MSASNDDFLFAQEAQALGYVSEAQVEEGFQLQRIMAEQLKIDERLAVILVKRGWLAEEQARRVFARIEPEGKKTEIPGYRLLERLGRGAMGTVYRAQHLGLQREVAIKVLHKDLAADTTQVERLKSEAKLLASLDHPNIVRALDAGETNGFPYIVMEYVEGETLRERLQREGRLREPEALKITRGLADALERARRMGVVHRDVKPGNVLLTRQGQPKLMDLGLAKGPVDLDLTQHGATVGTPQYISPEQAQDPRKADIRSDIYSLGATLYAMLAGRPPFEGTTLAEIITKVLYETPTPPRALNSEVSSEVGYLIERMMLKDPSLRYHTPAEVVVDIDRILDGRSIMPPGFRGNWEAFLLRRRIHRWVKVGSLALVGALALGFGAKVWFDWRQAQGERDEAVESIALLLPETGFGRDDTLLTVQSKLLRADEVLGRVQRLELAETEALRGRRAQLQALLDTFRRWHRLMGDALASGRRPDEPTVAELVARDNWRAAFAAVNDFLEKQIQPPGSENPVRLLAEAQRRTLLEGSSTAFLALQRGAREQRPGTLDDWVKVYAEYAKRAEAGFILQGEAKEGVPKAGELHAYATQVGSVVKQFESAYAPQVVQNLLERLEIGNLQLEVKSAREEVENRVYQAWNDSGGWPDAAALLGPGGLVRVRIDAVPPRVRDQVRAHVVASLATAKAWRDEGEEVRAAALLERLSVALNQALYGDLRDDVDKAIAQARAEAASLMQQAQEVYGALLARWLSDLQRLDGDTPAALRADATLSSADRRTLRHLAVDVEDLAPTGSAVERLYELALQGAKALQERRERLRARLRSGTAPEKGWLLHSVDVEGRSLEVSAAADRDRLTLSLFALAPEAIVRLAARAPAGPEDRFALALGALALLPPAGPRLAEDLDLRTVIADYLAAGKAFEGTAASPALLQHLAAELASLLKQDKAAEEEANRLFTDARYWYLSKEQRISTSWANLRLLLGSRRLKATKLFEDERGNIESLRREVLAVMAEQQLARWLPGAHVREVASRIWRVMYDFDTDDQLQAANFAAGKGVREPYSGTAVITPGGGLNYRLHLLRGYTEPSRDHPLVWRSIFDPAAPITVTFDLFALDTPYFLAVDIDGVQVAVLSLDPNWYPQFAFPPDVPLLEGEKKAPRLDGQGRGRGVAFHAGLDFGELAIWAEKGRLPGTAWTPEGRGRQHAEWTKAKPGQRLFAFEPESRNPGHVYKVKVVRERGRITLTVDNVVVASEPSREDWARIGTGLPGSGIVNGTGLIQIFTWTPTAIDDLTFEGTVKTSWIDQQERKEKERDAAQGGPR